MHTYLGKPITVPFDKLYLDVNNPRLGNQDTPGYDNLSTLFDPAAQDSLADQLKNVYDTNELTDALIGQGWMPIDNIIVWQPPKEKDRYIVVEGNTRLLTLRNIRTTHLPSAEKKLDRLKKSRASISPADIEATEELVTKLRALVADTDTLQVVPLQAKNSQELDERLPRVLAVRHITGPRGWGNYAQDLWMLQRYSHLHKAQYGGAYTWKDDIIGQVATESSLGKTVTRRRLRAAAAFSHFRTQFEDKLPADSDGETTFKPSDYYLFELLVRSSTISQLFEFTADAMHMPEDKEQVLFDWVFKKPRGGSADENENVFYRHENIRLWDQFRKYDADHGTNFANRFDVNNPDTAPTMKMVEAAFLTHKTRTRPQDLLEQLIGQLKGLSIEELTSQAEFLKPQVQELSKWTNQTLKLIESDD